ncbi:MAG TPA: hypothetical protein PK098_04435 [Phycisphaerales bacterium]|nr:hypothetical protein [Phycisphaerales bacterium]
MKEQLDVCRVRLKHYHHAKTSRDECDGERPIHERIEQWHKDKAVKVAVVAVRKVEAAAVVDDQQTRQAQPASRLVEVEATILLVVARSDSKI